MNKAFILLSAVFLCALAGCQERFDERLQREAREFTAKHCPQEREPGTVLDSTTYSPARRTYSLWYTFCIGIDFQIGMNEVMSTAC